MPILAGIHWETGLMAVLLTVQIALLILYSWLSQGPWRHLSLRGGRSARRTGRFFRQLQGIVAQTQAEVGRHRTRFEATQAAFAELRRLGQPPKPEQMLEWLAQCAAANDELRRELAAAKRRLEEQARRIERHINEARTDVLTGLPNRRALDDELRARLDSSDPSKPLCLALFDVDGFKAINDRWGHQAGDAVLQQLSERICRGTRAIDFVARYGGEEFAVLFPAIDPQDAVEVVERVRRSVGDTPVDYHGQPLTLTLSAGATSLAPRDSATSLLRRADVALYASKRGGRDCLHFHHDGELRRFSGAPQAPTGDWDGKERRRGPQPQFPRAPRGDESAADEQQIRQLCDELVERLQEVTQPTGERPTA